MSGGMTREGEESVGVHGRTPAGSMAMCPMAETCKGMIEKPLSGFYLALPGLVFIVLGILIIIEPKVLVWLIATACILFGIMMLMVARFVRGIGSRLRSAHP